MPTLELSAGPIDYRASGGGGPVVVLLHGVLMDSGQWREVEQRLGSDLRLVLPTLPLGGAPAPDAPRRGPFAAGTGAPIGKARSPELLIEHRANRDGQVSPQMGGQRIARDQVTAHRSVGQVEDREDRSLDRRP
jgi:pimeloyl-ACP methyl ester carboxylesterase